MQANAIECPVAVIATRNDCIGALTGVRGVNYGPQHENTGGLVGYGSGSWA